MEKILIAYFVFVLFVHTWAPQALLMHLEQHFLILHALLQTNQYVYLLSIFMSISVDRCTVLTYGWGEEPGCTYNWGGGGGSPKRLYKAPTDNAKPQQTIESPDRQYKAPKRVFKAPTDYTKPRKDYRNL